MERTKYWYSVISYTPDKLKNEKLNIGVIIHNPELGTVECMILDENNKKLRSILTNKVTLEEYKVRKTLLEHKLEKAADQSTILNYQLTDDNLILHLAEDTKSYYSFSSKQLIMTSNLPMLMNKLMETYIDKVFLNKETTHHTVKQEVKNVFKTRNLLGTRVKTDVTVTPVKELQDINYKIDFVYKNRQFHFVQAAPTNINNINEWFSKMKLIQNEMKSGKAIEIIYKKEHSEIYAEISPMLTYLNKDSSTEIIQIGSNNFNQLCDHISSESLEIKEYEKELLAI